MVDTITTDEERIITPFRVGKKNGQILLTFTDHNSMFVELLWSPKDHPCTNTDTTTVHNKSGWKITDEGLLKFYTETTSDEVNGALCYRDLEYYIDEVMNKCFTVKKPKNIDRSDTQRIRSKSLMHCSKQNQTTSAQGQNRKRGCQRVPHTHQTV